MTILDSCLTVTVVYWPRCKMLTLAYFSAHNLFVFINLVPYSISLFLFINSVCIVVCKSSKSHVLGAKKN